MRKALEMQRKVEYQLCIVQWHDHAQISDTQTSHESTSIDEIGVLGARLDNDTHAEDHHCDDNGHSPSHSISQISVGQCTNPSSEFENRGQHALTGAGLGRISLSL